MELDGTSLVAPNYDLVTHDISRELTKQAKGAIRPLSGRSETQALTHENFQLLI